MVHGPNGSGKTNLLEGVCVAACGDSPRARTTEELIRAGRQHGFVRGEFEGEQQASRIEVGLARSGERRLRVNGVARRRADLIGRAPVVLFWAQDVVTVRGEPAGRRRLLDRELAATSRSYYFSLIRYRRALEQRNRLLKRMRDGGREEGSLEAWDRAAAQYGTVLMMAREQFLAGLGPAAADAYRTVSGDSRPLVVQYRPSVAMPEGQTGGDSGKDRSALAEEVGKAVLGSLARSRRLDISSGTTTCGPHRDDMEFVLGDRPVRVYGSQGEQRSCAVAMRMGLAAVVRQMTGERPLLLLDDVLSELDERHREGIFSTCEESEQVVITCCDPMDIPPEARKSAAEFAVAEGRVVAR